jgi:hypothetical protein
MIFRPPVLPSPQQFPGTAQKRSRTPVCAKARLVQAFLRVRSLFGSLKLLEQLAKPIGQRRFHEIMPRVPKLRPYEVERFFTCQGHCTASSFGPGAAPVGRSALCSGSAPCWHRPAYRDNGCPLTAFHGTDRLGVESDLKSEHGVQGAQTALCRRVIVQQLGHDAAKRFEIERF